MVDTYGLNSMGSHPPRLLKLLPLPNFQSSSNRNQSYFPKEHHHLGEINKPFGVKLTSLDFFHPGRGNNLSGLKSINIPATSLFFLFTGS